MSVSSALLNLAMMIDTGDGVLVMVVVGARAASVALVGAVVGAVGAVGAVVVTSTTMTK